MSVYRQVADIAGVVAFPATAQVEIPFEPIGTTIVNQSNDDVEMSFNGIDVHGTLLRGNGLRFQQRAKRVWLRRVSPGAAATPVEVIAES